MSTSLPTGFQELETFVAFWCHDTNEARRAARCTSEMPDIQRFYDAVYARAPEAIEHCEQFALGEMPADTERLFKLLLALNHAAIAVEMHGQPRAHDAVWPGAVKIVQGPWPHGGQHAGGLL